MRHARSGPCLSGRSTGRHVRFGFGQQIIQIGSGPQRGMSLPQGLTSAALTRANAAVRCQCVLLCRLVRIPSSCLATASTLANRPHYGGSAARTHHEIECFLATTKVVPTLHNMHRESLERTPFTTIVVCQYTASGGREKPSDLVMYCLLR